MEIQKNFKFLKLEEIKRKNSEELEVDKRTFFKIDVLDTDNNLCSFMVFDSNMKDKIVKMQLKSLQDIVIMFKLTYNNSWNVNLVDIDVR